MINRNDVDSDLTQPAPEWLRHPASSKPIASTEDFISRADAYFEHCVSSDDRPTITGLALATGLPGPTTLIRLGQRVPALRMPISRCITAIAYGYEQMIGAGQATGPMFMLRNLPDFDPEESEGSPAVQFFNERKEVLLSIDVAGVAIGGEDYGDVDPLDVYLSIMKRPTSQNVTPFLIKPGGEIPKRPKMFTIIDSVAEAEE